MNVERRRKKIAEVRRRQTEKNQIHIAKAKRAKGKGKGKGRGRSKGKGHGPTAKGQITTAKRHSQTPTGLEMAHKKERKKLTQKVFATLIELCLSVHVFIIIPKTLCQKSTQSHHSAKKLFTTLCKLVPLTTHTQTTQICSPHYQNVHQTHLSTPHSPPTYHTNIQTNIHRIGQL